MSCVSNMEICRCCGKTFNEIAINIHGSYDYIHHTNFSNNIRVLFNRTDNLTGDDRVNAIVKEFFTNANDDISKYDAIEFLECFKHYNYSDVELMHKVFYNIQKTIDSME